MTEITKYIADDGTEFEDEDECLDYERTSTMKAIKGVKFFSEDGKEITNYSSLEDLLDLSYFIKITDKDDFDKFEELLYDELGCSYWADGWDSLKGEKGLFFYDEDRDSWISWEAEYDKLREIRRKMNY